MRRSIDVVVVAILCAASLWLGKLLYHNYWEHPRNAAASAAVTGAPELIVGRTPAGELELLRLTDPGPPTLLLVLSTTCPYCEETLDEWRAILDAADSDGAASGERNAVRTIVLSTSPAAETVRYVEANRLHASSLLLIGSEELAALGSSGVPTTVLVRPTDGTLRRWTGVLNSSEVEEIVALLGAAAATSVAGEADATTSGAAEVAGS